MTTAPPNLLAVRALVRKYTGLSANSTGITGDPNHRGGYHCGRDRVDSDDYSVVESPRDRAGLADWACAFDEGWWSLRVKGKTHDLRSHSMWMVAQCRANTPDSRDIREIIYSTDGKTVKRWDRLGKRTTGDKSHLEHTHRSYFRDATKSGKDLTALDRRYFTEIGLLEDDMSAKSDQILLSFAGGKPDIEPVKWRIRDEAWQSRIEAQLTALTGRDFTDEPAIVAGVLAGLDPAAIAAAIPADLARQVADELAARLQRPAS